MEKRDSLLLLQHRQGILDGYVLQRHLYNTALKSLEWGDEPRKGIEILWQKEPAELRVLKTADTDDLRCVRVLDSFFSDTLLQPDIRIPIFERALKGVRAQFLLADPRGPFGIARAKAIGQHSVLRSMEGLRCLAKACNEVRTNTDHTWKSREVDIVACRQELKSGEFSFLFSRS